MYLCRKAKNMELLVYKASAGSGKTFTLAVEYIKHLIRNPHAYRQILAVTFTNKATAEMKERILQQLYGIWIGDPASDAYLQNIRKGVHDERGNELQDEELRSRAGIALKYMLHDYSRFRVETIDSFFQSVMRNLARELELSPNLNIELDNIEVLSNAVDSLIERLTPNSPVLTWLLEYIGERIDDDKRWNISQEVKQFGRNIFNENYIERGELLRKQLQDNSLPKLYRDLLQATERKALAQMKSFSDRFEQELSKHGLSPEELKNGQKGIGSYFRKLRDGKLSDKDVMNQTLTNSLSSPDQWTSKTSKRKDDIIALAQNTLIPLLRAAEDIRPQQAMTVNSCRLSLQHFNKLRLLNHIDEEVRTLNQEQNRFLLSDTTALLHNLMREGDSSFVFEKIGTSIRTVMIDEFQDTSRMQWENFRLLLLEGLSQGADSLIVGDVKQSIYRWRNSDWEILNRLGHEPKNPNAQGFSTPLPVPVRIETLRTNRRSETRIIRFNNAIFPAAAEWLNNIHLSELKEPCLPLQEAYRDVIQLSPHDEERGFVQISFIQAKNTQEYTELTLEALGEEIKHLLDSGIHANDLAILVRKNKSIPSIANYLEQQLGLTVVSDEAFRLDASPTLCLLMDALRYLVYPNDRVALASLITGMQEDTDSCFTSLSTALIDKDLESLLPADFVHRRDKLRLMPLYDLLEELFELLNLSRFKGQDAYLFAFYDGVTDYLRTHSSETGEFIRFWDEQLCSKTIPAAEISGIRILSIHKSKGLEFHTILIPFCDWKLENETRDQLVWCIPASAPYNTLGLIPVTYSSTMAQSIYREDYLHERLQLWVDNLNLLYVAFTRPRKNMVVWCRQEQKGTVSELLAATLPKAVQDGIGQWDASGNIYRYGSPFPSAIKTSQGHTNPSLNRLTEMPTALPVQMTSTTHSIEFRQSNLSADFIAGNSSVNNNKNYINRGQMLHTLFSAIQTPDDVDNAITRLVFDGIINTPEQEAEIRTLVRKAFANPAVQEWYDGSWQVLAERDIIWMEQNQLCNRRPDRVMIRSNQVIVVDFKFGKPRQSYQKQVNGYMQLLVRMGHKKEHIRGYLWYVDENRIEEVRIQ